ncbi:MAG: isochorismatase family protein [archaeon]|nr:isochorismatase family protein [archaeon]
MIKVDNIAVLLIDMQEGFTEYIPTDYFNKLIRAQRSVINYLGNNDIPLVVLEYKPIYYGETDSALLDAINCVQKTIFISKKSKSGFKQTNLRRILSCFNRKNLYLMGVYADQCVKATAQDAINDGYNIATSGDVISEVNGRLSTTWFEENGLFTKTYKGMIQRLEKSL